MRVVILLFVTSAIFCPIYGLRTRQHRLFEPTSFISTSFSPSRGIRPQSQPKHDVVTLRELRASINNLDDRSAITALAKAIKTCKQELIGALQKVPVNIQLASHAAAELSSVSPLPSPAFAANLLVGRFSVCGTLGKRSRVMDLLLCDQSEHSETTLESSSGTDSTPASEVSLPGEESVFLEIQLSESSRAAKPSKSGSALRRGSMLNLHSVRTEAEDPASKSGLVATLTCNGPSSFEVCCSMDDGDHERSPPSLSSFLPLEGVTELWKVAYLDQDLLICDATRISPSSEESEEKPCLLFLSKAAVQ